MPSKPVFFGSIVAFALLTISLPITAFSEGAFLRTTQALDEEPRGYCLDVSGPPERINLDAALQVHTCKYGQSNEDQLFEWVEPGRVHMPEYDVCLAANNIDAGEKLFVQSCASAEHQSWNLTAAGLLSPTSRPDLCVTLGAEPRPAGAPAWLSPVYHARELSLERCDGAAQARQQLRWGPEAEQERSYAKQVGDEMPAELAAAIRQNYERGVGSAQTSGLYTDQPRVYELDELEVVHDISYGPHEQHRLDIHTDKYRRSDVAMPVVIYFHGGGFVRGNRDRYRNVPDYFASLGLVGVNATYRLVPGISWPEGAHDIGSAITWVKDNISEYGGDPNQIFVIGKSAGASHVATYAFRPDVMEPGTPTVAGIILISGTYDADTADPSEARLAYYGEDLSRWPAVSTIGNVQPPQTPVMFSISEYDNAGPIRSLPPLLGELVAKQGEMPRVVQLIGHDHYSPNPSIGTQDTQLSAAILQFVRSVAGTQQQMTAR